MRVLHIIHSMDPLKGGPSEGLRHLGVAYLHEGHEMEVATLDDPKAPYLRDLPYPVHALGPGLWNYGFSRPLLHWLRANTGRFDSVIVNGLWQYHGRAAWLAMHGRQRYAVFTHGMLDPYFNKPYLTKLAKKWPYWFLAERHLLADAHRVFFTSEAEQNLAAKSLWPYKANGMVVPYGTPGPASDPDTCRRAFFDVCPQVADKRFLLFLGRIHPKKGCDLLIEAFAAAAPPAVHLVMAGPDQTDWRPRLEERAAALGVAQRIHWPGMLREEAKWGAFYASDAFVLPSHQENFGIAVAEALACSTPVLISDKVNIFEEVRNDGAALVETDTRQGTTELIRRWFALDPAQSSAMRLAARQCFERRYNSEQLAHATLSVFS